MATFSDTIRLAEARRATGKRSDSVARPRWQRGWLFKRGKRNPVWVGRFREDYLTGDGTRKRRERSVILGSCAQIGKRQAQRSLSERLASINQGTHKSEMVIPFERFVLERWEPNPLPTLRFSTQRKYRNFIRAYSPPTLGRLNLSEIGPADVQAVLAHHAKRLAPHTGLTIRNLLSKILGTAVKWGYVQVNAAIGAQAPSLINQRERRTLSPDEARRLLSELAEPYSVMVTLALLSGLRRAEIFGLKWKYVDFREKSLIVAETRFEGRVSAPKTRASRRKVFLDDAVLDALRAIRPACVQPDDLVFSTERGKPMNPANVLKRVLAPACDRAGIGDVTWHHFRYTYSTWAEPTGESVKALQAQLGHTDSRLTLPVYTQPMPEAQAKIARKMARVLLPVAPNLAYTSKVPGGMIQ